ncbi:hypothetical protein Tco_0287661 [Tanacetum coccineum]
MISEQGESTGGADEEMFHGVLHCSIVYGYDGLPNADVSPPFLRDYCATGPEHHVLTITCRLNLDSSAITPLVDPIPSVGDTEAFETDEVAPTPVPSPRRHTARMSVRPQTPILLPSEVEVERLLALPIPPPSPLTLLSSPLPHIPSPPLPPPPSSLHLPSPVPISLPLPLSPLPPLPASLFIPPVDRREDTSEAELPSHKRLCLTALTSRYKVGESSTAASRPTGGHGADYGFIGTINAEGQLSAALGQIQALHARDQTHVDDREGAASMAVGLVFSFLVSDNHNNMPPRRSFATARAVAAAATPMTAAAIKQLIEARVSVALANHETL